MEAMILAAGEGTRLRPLTQDTPKAMLPVGERPLIEWQLAWLKSHGITRVAINLHHLGEQIREHLRNGSGLGMEIAYSPEPELLGTAGGVKKMAPFFGDAFVVVYGDVLTDFDLGDMMDFHRERQALATVALVEAANPKEMGIVNLNEDGMITDFVEKPAGPVIGTAKLANGGIYVLGRDVLDYIQPGFCDFAYDVFPALLRDGKPVYGYALKKGEYLQDIGSPERYRKAGEDVKEVRVKITKHAKSGISG